MGHAKADPIRMLLSKAGVEFNNVTLTFDEWGAAKASGKYPTGQVPLWETPDGRKMNQAFAILRYLGRQHGFYDGADLEESLIVDWVLETSVDLQVSKAYAVQLFGSTDAAAIEAAKANFSKFNKQISEKLTSRGKPFIAGDRLTIADFVVLSHYLCLHSTTPANTLLLRPMQRLPGVKALSWSTWSALRPRWPTSWQLVVPHSPAEPQAN